jgi:hypothetical protein
MSSVVLCTLNLLLLVHFLSVRTVRRWVVFTTFRSYAFLPSLNSVLNIVTCIPIVWQ